SGGAAGVANFGIATLAGKRVAGIVRVGRPVRLIGCLRLQAPGTPALTLSAREQFQIVWWAARFDEGILLVRLAGMFALACPDTVHLSPARCKRSRILAADAEQQQFGDIAEVETDATSIRAAVLAKLVPYDVCLVVEAPRAHDEQAVGQ